MTNTVTTGQIGQVISPDGTPIGYERSGEGPPLVVVHGATSNRRRWAPILPALEERFTVYAVDRRGRGASGDAPTYSIEREFEDIAAIVDAIGGPVDLIGHSYGALCVLEAATRSANVGRIVLYEPPIPTDAEVFPGAVVARLEALLEAGDRDGLLITFCREVVRMPEIELELLRSLPTWQTRIEVAHTIPRELRAADAYVFDPARFSGMRAPSLLLLGGDSPTFVRAATQVLNAALPASRIAILPGQQHIAMNTAPELFLSEVLGFLGGA